MALTVRVVVLTGGSRGIGRALALRLADEGADVVLVARDGDALEEVAEAVRARGKRAVAVPCDLGDRGALDALAPRVVAALGRVDAVVHNAGIEPYASFASKTADEMRAVVEVNLVAPMVLTAALLPELRRTKGRVVFMGSTSGLFVAPWTATYGATKAAVASLARSLAIELEEDGVGVSVVQPGYVLDVGMFADRRGEGALQPPPWIGGTTSERVADAVIRALTSGVVDQVVNRPPMRGLIAVASLWPSLGIALSKRLLTRFLRRVAHP